MPTNMPGPDDEDGTTSSDQYEVRQDNQFGILPRAVAFSTLSMGAKALYGTLAQYAGASEKAWPSRKTLAEKMGVSIRSITRYTTELVDAGFVAIETRTNGMGMQVGNIYYLGSMIHRRARPESGPRHQWPARRDTSVPPGGTPVAHGRRTIEEEPLKRRAPARGKSDFPAKPKNYEAWVDLANELEDEG